MRRLLPLFMISLALYASAPVHAADAEALFRTASDLRNTTPAAQEQALVTLVQQGPAALPLLLTKLKDGRSIEQQTAAQALGLIGDPQAEDALLQCARSNDPFAAGAAQRALAELYTHYPAQGLAERLQNTQNTHAIVAALFAAFLKCERDSAGTESLDAVVEPAVRQWAKDPGPYRNAALATLAYGTQEESAIVLTDALVENDRNVILAALKSLQVMKPTGSAVKIEPLTKSQDSEILLEAFAALHLMNYKGTETAFSQFLSHSDPRLRTRAIELIVMSTPHGQGAMSAGGIGHQGQQQGSLGGEQIQQLLISRSEDNPQVRLAAVKALMDIGDPTAGRALAGLIGEGGDENSKVRAAAAVALAKLGQSGWYGPLSRDARDTDANRHQIRLDAIRALGIIRDPQNLRVLLDALADPNPEVAGLAADALAVLGDKGAGKALYKQLRTGLAHVPDRAREALTVLYQDDPGPNPAAWPAWGKQHNLTEE